jgi:NAD(P)H dehydrogenase (quinone)
VTRIAVIHYSATGNVHALAREVADGAVAEGVDVRLRHVAELAPEMQISFRQHWGRHRSEIEDQPDASIADLEWADGIAFGTPTRFGNVAAHLKVFLDLAGELWARGALVDKVATSFTASQAVHGGRESTILALNNTFDHWGCDRAADQLHGARGLQRWRQAPHVRAAGERTATRTSHVGCCRAQGARLARVTAAVTPAREAGMLAPKAAATTSPSNRKG